MEICLVTHRTQITPRWIGNQRMSWEIKKQDIQRVGDCPGRRSPQRNLLPVRWPLRAAANGKTVKIANKHKNLCADCASTLNGWKYMWAGDILASLRSPNHWWQGRVHHIEHYFFVQTAKCKTPNPNTTISGRKMFKKKTNKHTPMNAAINHGIRTLVPLD